MEKKDNLVNILVKNDWDNKPSRIRIGDENFHPDDSEKRKVDSLLMFFSKTDHDQDDFNECGSEENAINEAIKVFESLVLLMKDEYGFEIVEISDNKDSGSCNAGGVDYIYEVDSTYFTLESFGNELIYIDLNIHRHGHFNRFFYAEVVFRHFHK